VDHQIIIVGTGFGAQAMAIALRKAGFTDFVMLERRSFAGGTWKQNRYPGAAVDVQSPLYSLSSTPYPWTRMFAEQAELAQYTDDVYRQFKLAQHVKLEHNVEQCVWQEASQLWQIQITDRAPLTCQFVINASGPLSQPVIPQFKGAETFAGRAFHTNDWPDDVDLSNQRVAIIGSGASATQVIPAITDRVQQLHVFQRTPHWVIPRPDIKFPKWVQRCLAYRACYYPLRYAIYWGLELRVLGFKYFPVILKLMGEWPARRLLKKQIADPSLRALLTPDYTIGCKRIIMSNTLYPALSRSHVTLHNKDDGIAEITATGITTTQGTAIPLDILVYATGFDATDGLISYPVIGEKGQALSDFWADYPRAYLGTTIPFCPNFFIMTGPNTGIGHTSAIVVIESQVRYILQALRAVCGRNAKSIQPTVKAESDYTAHIHREMARTVWHRGGCNSWYKSASGKVIAMFPGFSFVYRRLCQRFKWADHKIQ
jgi:cation diffusion facilitator CzcD-associated flavoprotein CzcO